MLKKYRKCYFYSFFIYSIFFSSLISTYVQHYEYIFTDLIFLQKIKIKLSLNFFKKIIKIFLISGTIYYFPIICIQIFLVFFKN